MIIKGYITFIYTAKEYMFSEPFTHYYRYELSREKTNIIASNPQS